MRADVQLENCGSCGKPTPAAELTRAATGPAICRHCLAKQQYGVATRRALRHQEFRSCHACGMAIEPELVHTDGDEGPRVAIQKRYSCDCGKKFTVLTWKAVLVVGFAGAVCAGAAGNALRERDFEQVAGMTLLTAGIVAWLLYDAWLRRRNPRAR